MTDVSIPTEEVHIVCYIVDINIRRLDNVS